MTDKQHIDPERLAALLDGRLNAAEAEAVRQQLATADDDTLAAYADAIALSAEIGSTPDIVGDVIPIGSARRGRRWTLAASAAVAAGVVAILLYRAPSRSEAYQPSIYASGIPGGVGVSVEQPWSATRGGSDGISDHARAVRVGVLLTDIELEGVRRDTSKTHLLALAAVLGNTPASGPILSAIRPLTDSNAAPSLEQVHAVGRQALALVDNPLADAGAYLEAARIATLNGDSTFVHQVPPASLLPLLNDARLSAATKDAVRSLEADLGKRPIDPQRLSGQLTTVLQMLTQ